MTHQEPSQTKQWQISLFAGLLFLLVCLPKTYELTGQALGYLGIHLDKTQHLLLHVAVFILLTKFSMSWRLF